MNSSARARGLVAAATPLLEHLLTSVGVGVIVTDMRRADAPIAYVNPSFERITGYGADEVIGRNCRFMQGPGTDPDAVAALGEAVAAGTEAVGRLLNYRRDGSTFINEIRLAPVPGDDGAPDFYLGLLSDVTDRLRAETRLAEAAALTSSVFNAMSEGIIVFDAQNRVVDVNPAVLEFLGMSRDEFARAGWMEAAQPRFADDEDLSLEHSPRHIAVAERRTILGVRMQLRRADGVQRLVSVNYEPLLGDGSAPPGGVVVSFREITERQRVQEDLQMFASLVEMSSDFVAIAAPDNSVLYVNEAGRQLVGLASNEEARCKKIHDFLTDEGRRESREVEQPAVLATGRWEGEGTLCHFRTRASIPVRISSYLVRHPDSGEPWALATVQRDITAEKRATAELVASRERYLAQFRGLPLPTYVWQRTGDDFRLIEFNAAAQEYSPSVHTLLGASANALYGDAPEILLAFERCWSSRSHLRREMPNRSHLTGQARHLIMTFAFVPPDLVLVHALDITQRVESERRLLDMAEHDDLTRLYNRRYFEDRLGATLGVRDAAVLIVDVDHFKFVNDSLGHGAGDELLREVAGAMRSRLRDDDVLARFGGDEFAVLITDADEAHATAAANHVLTAIRTSVTGVSVTASAGAAVFAAGSRLTASDAIVAADIALYEAKQRGRDRVELYSGQAGQSLTWVEQIRAAIADERLVLHAQPVLDLRGESERPLFELLVRMVGDGGEIIPPSSFLPTAEQFGLIREIDRWVLGQGIAFAAQGNAVSINLSARSLGDPGLPAVIAQLLDETGAQPGHVTLEFTETAAVSSVEDARTFTRSLRELGCAAALDDFGTGFGTFLLLKHLPVSALKIDTEFVRELATSPADQRIVRGIVGLAADAGIRTVAEGVEDAGTLALLRDYGVDYAQGYHIARPAPLGEHGAPARPSRQRDSDALSI